MDKSADAFRTISEVAEVLDTPAHVLRFWESRFPQIRPVKRAGGRRYYRPADIALLTGIKHLLHDEGLTIRGVQKILREQGVRHVAGLSGQDVADEGDTAEAALEAALAANFDLEPEQSPLPQDQVESAQIVALETALRARAPAVMAPDEATVGPPDVPPAPQAPPADLADDLPLFGQLAPPVEAPSVKDATPQDEGDAPEPVAAGTPASAAVPTDLLGMLRALPPASLDGDSARALHARLAALVARMKVPPFRLRPTPCTKPRLGPGIERAKCAFPLASRRNIVM